MAAKRPSTSRMEPSAGGARSTRPPDPRPASMPDRKRSRRRGTSEQADGPAFRLNSETLVANRLIADFMKTASRVEQYLHSKRPLTDLQYESIATTIEGLRTFLQTWRTQLPKMPR